VSRLEVTCRACGHRFFAVPVRAARSWHPNDCPVCESDDLVALLDLTDLELAELEEEIAKRGTRHG
jgi:hypothetical protein